VDGSGEHASGPGWDLHCGDWRTALAHVGEVDALICDPPYSARTEAGFRTGSDVGAVCGMGYDPISEDWARGFVASWHPRTRGWFVVCGDHVSWGWYERALRDAGRYVFPPVVIMKTGAPPRMAGDGPASWCEYICSARPREQRFMKWGSLPGWYSAETVRALNGYNGVRGAKPIALMRALVRDYTRPGDVIAEPCAGSGTTLLAAVTEGRRAVGAELDPAHFTIARKRLQRGFTAPLLLESAGRPAEQLELEGDVG
jgi:site-specific DNA-methyltransferase (adenine-specific)